MACKSAGRELLALRSSAREAADAEFPDPALFGPELLGRELLDPELKEPAKVSPMVGGGNLERESSSSTVAAFGKGG